MKNLSNFSPSEKSGLLSTAVNNYLRKVRKGKDRRRADATLYNHLLLPTAKLQSMASASIGSKKNSLSSFFLLPLLPCLLPFFSAFFSARDELN